MILEQATKDAEEVSRILDEDFWAVRSLLEGRVKQLINTQAGVHSIRFSNPEQAKMIRRLTMEEALDPVKINLDIDKYRATAENTVIESDKDLKVFTVLKKQIKATKALVESSTELELLEKHEAYKIAKKDADEKWDEYKNIRDPKNALIKAIKSVSDMVKDKISAYNRMIEDSRLEEERKKREAEAAKIREKEEAERKEQEAKQAEILAKQELERKANEAQEELIREEKAKRDRMNEKTIDVEAEEQPEENKTPPYHLSHHGDTSPPSATPPQAPEKEEEGNDGHPVRHITPTQGLKIEVFDMGKFQGAVMMGERGAPQNLVIPNYPEIEKFALNLNCKPGDEIVRGCRVAPLAGDEQ